MNFKAICGYLSIHSVLIFASSSDNISSEYEMHLPPEHMACYFASHQNATKACEMDDKCPYKNSLNQSKCWGYEGNCSPKNRYSTPVCDGSSKGWSKSKNEQLKSFFTQGDFGYIKERKQEITVLCDSKDEKDSFLECAKFMRFCRARNIMFDFKSLLDIPEPMRYREDVIKEGQVGGHCKLKKKLLKAEGHQKSPLQSWFAELEHFEELPYQPITEEYCDVIIDKPTFIMKLDATVNMYHHFCDFLNLYATLHLNDTFTTDIFILIWDTIPYHSNFAVTWQAFTTYPVMNLGQFKGKKVCLKDVIFPLLPRMIFGMYYNMPLIPGCENSGLFRAFAEHIKHRLEVKSDVDEKIRVTVISRGTQYRRILNEDELISAMKTLPHFSVRKVNFNRQLPFLKQLEISYNTDILIGIHGAGLTHMLFMPEWGAVFEIFNCEDENCYADLARLRGLKYLTWEKKDKIFPEDEGHHPTLGAHAKFTNYAFDVEEFLRLIDMAAEHVKNHPSFLRASTNCKDCHHSTDSHNEL